MEKNKLNDSLMAVMIEEEAWKGTEEADYHGVIKVNSCRILPEFGNYFLSL